MTDAITRNDLDGALAHLRKDTAAPWRRQLLR
jgi:hypothetical protein